MIQQQIRPWDVADDRVLETMNEIPREQFVPEAYRGLAYAEIGIPLAHQETMLEPKLVARMLQALKVQPGERVLEIGTGSGYVTACLARLGGRVLSLELHDDLVDEARDRLAQLNVRNAELRTGDGLAGPLEGAPFDAIAVTGSLPDEAILEGLKAQLGKGGRLFAIVGEDPVMEAVLVTRVDQTHFHRQDLFETNVPPLANAPEPEHFVF
jgi:protein-L-isoaspartate(D-aspartate) O-methyltransferase